MQADFARTVDGLLIPGAVAVVRTPAGSYTLTHGTTTIGADIQPRATDYFRIGSVTKTMTGAVVLQLVQEGRLAVEDPIDRYLPGVPNGANITVSDLLDMRSGLHNYLDTVGFDAGFNQNPSRVWARQELLALAYAEPPSFPPGTAFEYSNTNTILLGLLTEKLEGKPLSAVLSGRLFAPLGMTHTSLPDATTTTLPDPSSRGYQYGRLQVADVTLPRDQAAAAAAGALKPNDVTAQSPSWSWAAGGVVSTAEDMSTWIQALVGGKVLNPAMQQRWVDSIRLQDPTDPRLYYGWGITQLRFGAIRLTYHEGQLSGFNTEAVMDAANQVSILIWTNRAMTQGRDNAQTVLVALLGHIYQTPADTPPA